MSEKEFELYLTLLSRFLKLSPEQCAAISDELRDHLEERFEELCRQGHSRDDAIRQALEEFGDASHLATHFSELTKQRRRRFVMRCTLASILVGAITIFTIPAFLPQNGVINIPARAVAQKKVKPETSESTATNVGSQAAKSQLATATADTDLPKALREKTTLEFTDTPLGDVCKQLAKITGMQVILDQTALIEEGMSIDEPVSIRVQDLPLHIALTWMLRPMALDWRIQDRLLHITTVVENEDPEHYFSRTYNVREILKVGFDKQELLDTLLEVTLGPWQETDGDGGTLDLVGDLLVVRQCYHRHRELAALVNGIGQHVLSDAKTLG